MAKRLLRFVSKHFHVANSANCFLECRLPSLLMKKVDSISERPNV